MKTSFKSTAAAALALALSASSLATSANAGTCWIETGFYVPYNCQVDGKDNTGAYIMVCCD